jgi:DNA (cytosine-5)-methyltransferase 1
MGNRTVRYIDLFCGIGGFRIAAENVFQEVGIDSKCVFSCDIDPYSRKAYEANFGEEPYGDITKIKAEEIPDHDLLFAGFPCQPFSIIGNGKGFQDIRGTLFFEIARILEAKKPAAFLLENVKRLVSHQGGRTFRRIIETLEGLGYCVDKKVLNALDFGLPQKRERVLIVGYQEPTLFSWPTGSRAMIPLSRILEKEVSKKHFVSDKILEKRMSQHISEYFPAIWHENKAGNICSYPYSCALRAGASYNYLLVNGIRRLTPREMLRLQGFPDSFKIAVPDSQVRKQAGNAVPVPMVEEVIKSMLPNLSKMLNLTTTRQEFEKGSWVRNGRKKNATASDGR